MQYKDYLASRKDKVIKVNEGTVQPAVLDRETEVRLEARERKAVVDRSLVPHKGKPRKLMDPM